MWAQAGLAYYESMKEDKDALAPRPGEDYVVVDFTDPTRYISFPRNNELETIRHHAVMVRRKQPHVPRPSGTPLPTTHLYQEERCRFFNIFKTSSFHLCNDTLQLTRQFTFDIHSYHQSNCLVFDDLIANL